jgi:hypothetical protein
LKRTCERLGLTPKQVADDIGCKVEDLELILKGSRLMVAATNEDEIWLMLYNFCNEKIGVLLGIREELQRKASLERKRNLRNRERITRT